MSEAAKYTKTAIVLHWLMAVLMTVGVVLILIVELLPDPFVRPVIDTHKSIGITVLGLAVMRLLWRVARRPPPLPRVYSRLEKAGAHAAHAGLYGLIFALPLSGWMHDSAWKAAAAVPMSLFGLVPWPRIGAIMSLDPATKESFHILTGIVHRYLGYALYGLVFLHVAGAFKHQLIDREPELQRMLP